MSADEQIAGDTACANCQLEDALTKLQWRHKCMSGSYTKQSRRLELFKRDHPELWRLYFTNEGEAERLL